MQKWTALTKWTRNSTEILSKHDDKNFQHVVHSFFISMRKNSVEAQYAYQNFIFSLKLFLTVCLDFNHVIFHENF